ncbi:hypothetical protein JMN32_25200 [Fulvivirga sp. 29W222]|uniref:RHS repeat-associated core domain-containing protein n=1 Tax=Fulvivirga marina TaxID=2494733 RepID=A0A937G423_9BACT|nr:hypothetical protein [Fulvivirga marina]
MTAKKNDFLFNSIERETELGLGWDLAHYRAYDPAIGRWLQIDPKTSERESPYVGFANMPNFYIDPLGDTIKYGNYTINNFWNDTYMGQDLKRIGNDAYDATLGKLGDWIDGLDKESTTEKASGWGVTIEGEKGAGEDSEYSKTADPLENNSVMEQEFLDGFTAGFRALHAPSQNGEFGKAVEAVANGVNSTVKAVKEAEKVFSETPQVGDQVQGTKTTAGNIQSGFTNITDSTKVERKWESDGKGNYKLIKIDTVKRKDY